MKEEKNIPLTPWENSLRSLARQLPYPPTPDLAGGFFAEINSRELQGSRASRAGAGFPVRSPGRAGLRAATIRIALAAVVLLLALLAVPGVRAAILEFLQIGPVRIFLVEPTPAPTPAPPTGTPAPTPTLLPSLTDLSGQTTLEAAQSQVDFPIQLPAYPESLGRPDYVFVQYMDAPVLILAWDDPERPGRIGLSLQEIPPDSYSIEKVKPVTVQETSVNGNPAVWTVGPYLLRLKNGDHDIRRLIAGHVLIWQEGENTFRLETDLPLEEAVKVASSLQPWEAEK